MLPPTKKLTVLITLLWTGVLVFSWGAMLASPTGWTQKTNVAYTLKLGLLEVHLVEGSWKGFAHGILGDHFGTKLVKKLKPFTNQVMTTNEHWDFWCNLGANHCLTAKIVALSTWMMLICSVLSVTLLAMGGILLYIWTFGKARALMRHTIKVFYTLATVSFLLGTLQYYFMMKYITSLPPMSSGTPTGSLTILAMLLTISSFGPTWVVWSLKATEDEIRNELENEFVKIGQDLKLQNGYGGANMGARMPLPPQPVPFPLSDPAIGSSYAGSSTQSYPGHFQGWQPEPHPYPPVFTGNSGYP